MRKDTKSNSKKKIIFIVAMVIIISATALYGCNSGGDSDTDNSSVTQQNEIPEYENVSNDEYVRDGQKCILYRVTTAADLSDSELLAVFGELCTDDDYYLHTVYFYSDRESALGNDAYDIAALEEITSGSDPEITRK